MTETAYPSMEIELLPRRDSGYPVRINLHDGSNFFEGDLPADAIPWVASGDPQADGRRLFEALFNGKLRGAWYAIRQRARVRLRLDPDAPELCSLPWELLCNDQTYLAAADATPFSRYVYVDKPVGQPVGERPIRMLAVVANPTNLSDDYGMASLDVDTECAELETLADTLTPERLTLKFLDAPATPERLETLLREWRPHILHLVAHGVVETGRKRAVVYLADEADKVRTVPDGDFCGLIGRLEPPPSLVFLAACESAAYYGEDAFAALAPRLVQAGVPAVVAMQDAISVKACRKMTPAFYSELFRSGEVDRALNAARSLLLTGGSPDAPTPLLLMRLADGKLLGSALEVEGPSSALITGLAIGGVVGAAGGLAAGLALGRRSPSESPTASPPPTETPPEPVGSSRSRPVGARSSTLLPDLILIPAGKFLMGSDTQPDKQSWNDETPQHWLYLPDYYIGRTPVTNAQYREFVRATGHRTPSHWKDGLIPPGKDDHPVVYVFWNDALAYCQWLADETGKPYTLPSEAEWEKAARGTDGRLYPWGNTPPNERLCNFGNNVKDTTPVGKYSPAGNSPYGCVDMAGNVWEWTRTLELRAGGDYFTYPYRPDDGRENLTASGWHRVRGGSWWSGVQSVRCAARFDYWDSDGAIDYVGLRVGVAASFSRPSAL